MGANSIGLFGAQWPSWVAAGLFASCGAFLILPARGASPRARERLSHSQWVSVGVTILVVASIAVFMLPVLDWHWGWNGFHGHTYPGRGFHFH